MPVIVQTPNAREPRREYAADDLDVDDSGTLVLSRGDGRDEQTIALFAPGAWLAAERT
ncbi:MULTISPECIES: hypothetical protein [Streptomycetaceae]|uniref:Uncharacterized protein n=1 Tax=Streptantibioticus cattleyicolor (strain ATCC 35852 / DSM 46488 / JCM 4925 / NBRC 14057 / NRRL 8057) TaxID=1003195 RepID=G8WRC1_STREN|nr:MULTISPECIES: hypothetical protein [Streptomycetaceae]AEW92938.1 hypothetical protein SCATT_05670 [Streptantibioticus cattleyicolor NRRL 8057 = DSM 46488]MYS57685.1 hypothetical protein [Streptomyces sp. SID5468]